MRQRMFVTRTLLARFPSQTVLVAYSARTHRGLSLLKLSFFRAGSSDVLLGEFAVQNLNRIRGSLPSSFGRNGLFETFVEFLSQVS